MRLVTFAAAMVAMCTADLLPNYAWNVHRVKSFDGTDLSVNTFEPNGLANDSSAPIVIFVNSWLFPSVEYTSQCQGLAQRGYFAVQYASRGWYTSKGEVSVAAPNDIKDHTAILEWVEQNWGGKVNSSSVAAVGISYGAGISLIAGALNPNIKAVVAMSGWADLLDALNWNQAPSFFWSQVLVVSVKLLGDPLDELYSHLDNVMSHTDLNSTRAWTALRSPKFYIDLLNARKVPVFIGNNFEDHLFHSNFQIDLWQQLQGPKRLTMSQGMHFQAELTGLLPLIPNSVWDEGKKWIYRFLRGELNGIDEAPLVSMEVSAKKRFSLLPGENPEFTKVMYSAWPPTRLSEAYKVLQYGLRPRGWTRSGYGALVAPGSGHETSEVLAFTRWTVMNTGIPALTAFMKPWMLHEVNFRRINSDREVVFISDPFKQDTRVCGNVVLEGLRARSLTHERFQVMSYLWRVEKAGWFKFLGREATLLAHGPLAVWESTIGEDVALPTISFHAVCSDIPKGESIGLGVNLYNALYKGPTHDNGLRVELKYTRDTILSVPTVALVEEH